MLKKGDTYRHRNGTLYRIVAVAQQIEEQGGATLVIYRRADGRGEAWAQSQERFLDGRFVREPEGA